MTSQGCIDELTVLLYTHKDYSDVLRIYLETYKKYLSDVPLSVCVNDAEWLRKETEGFFTFQHIYQYDETLPYAGRIASILEQIDTPYTLINQEINVVVDYPAKNLFQTCIDFMKQTGTDQLRLSDSGLKNLIRNQDLFHPMQDGYIMSVISAIWKTSSVLTLYKTFQTYTYRTIESGEVQQYVRRNLKNYYISSPLDVEHPPLHALSWHFPSIHVTHFGKWCIHSKMNAYYIYKLLDTYGVDISKRGIFTF
jgi:hypothetical protein